MFKSIRWKLECMIVLVTVIVVLLTGAFFGVHAIWNYKQEFAAQAERMLQGALAEQLNQNAVAPVEGMPNAWELIHQELVRRGNAEKKTLYILYPDGTIWYDGNGVQTDGGQLDTLPYGLSENIIAALAGRTGNSYSMLNMEADYAKPVFDAAGNVKEIIYLCDSPQGLAQMLQKIVRLMGQACLMGGVIALIAGLLVVRMITRPVRSLTEKAKQIAAGDFDAEVKISSRDDIGKLSQTLDQMAAELQSNISDIEEEKNKLETIQTFMSDGVMAFDAAGELIHINRAAAKMLEVPEKEKLQFDEYFHSIGIQISIAELVFKSETVLRRYYEKDGRHIEMLFARMSKGEKTTGVITMLHDVTQQQKLDAARREFVANVSHELRTPITTIKSYTETVKETEDLPREVQKRFLGIVEKEADRMTRLIHDLLTLSSLDNDKLNQKAQPFDLAVLITEVVDKLGFDKKKGQTLTYTQISELPKFMGNPDRMEQVLTNVISNAVKYTPEDGEINVFSGYLYDYIYVKVQDTGIGIAKKALPYVFDRFYRTDRARSRNEGGTGLGLAIAKEIVEEHGGSISITSQQGKGSEVLIQFPIKKVKKESEKPLDKETAE
ncbi:MAG: cell wall metabolism sensor histidine kinase WalK [Clostridia bacterium]|nr:cell wall metabolism sensor histidine kinase WalK [Clostridia bacterium]